MSSRVGSSERAMLVALWVLATALNIAKPFHIDDVYYLTEAQWIAEHPTEPMSGEIFWTTDAPEPFHRSNISPLLIPYVMAGVIRLAGPSPLALHALTAVYAAIAIALFHALARRWAPKHALLLTALFVLSPAFIAEQNVMLDVPLVASWLAFFLVYDDGATPRKQWGAALVASLALMIKFTSFALLAFLFIEAVRKKAWSRLVVLALPLAVVVAYSVWNFLEYGGVQMIALPFDYGALQTATGRAPLPSQDLLTRVGAIAGRGALWIVTLGSIATGLYAALPRIARLERRFVIGCGIALVLLFPVGLALAHFGPEQLRGEPWQHTLLRLVCFMIGLVVLRLSIAQARGGDEIDKRLATWAACAALFVIVLSPFIAARHGLLAWPAFLLLFGRHARLSLDGLERPLIGVALLFGAWVAIADARIAGVYESSAESFAQRFEGERVFFVGHWGWQHYAERAGLEVYIPEQSDLGPGDVVIEPVGVDVQRIAQHDRVRMTLLDTVHVEPVPVLDWMRTLIDREGLYCVWKGLPWTIRTEPMETFRIWRIEPTTLPGSATALRTR